MEHALHGGRLAKGNAFAGARDGLSASRGSFTAEFYVALIGVFPDETPEPGENRLRVPHPLRGSLHEDLRQYFVGPLM
jgi:hypothetical protein